MGYFARGKVTGHLRATIDRDHPQHLLDIAPNDPSRWNSLGISLREVAHPRGPIILVGMSEKYRSYMSGTAWELKAFADLRKRFPNSRIIFRPKKNNQSLQLPCDVDTRDSIFDVLQGTSLVSCHHSNVAIDATIVGVPFETEDGAAIWLASRPYTVPNRLEFLQRLAWFQWRVEEMRQAWDFFMEMERKI
jgi:hypothetical protein